MFERLKVGDKVFVVKQNSRFRNDQPRQTFKAEIEKLGRKYGYIKAGCFRGAFCLQTGKSHHNENSNARANGFGFDVYESEEDYLREQRRVQQLSRLQERLVSRHGKLYHLAPHVVELIHQLLDEEGLD